MRRSPHGWDDSYLRLSDDADDADMGTPHPATLIVPALCAGAICAVHARAGDFDLDPGTVDPAMVAFLDDSASVGLRRADDRELSIQALGASDFNGTTIMAAGAGVDWFVADGLSVGIFGEGLHVNQSGDNAVGIGAGVMVRWHVIERQSLSVFTEFGVGYALFDSPVPVDGVSGDFTPRAAIGMNLALDATTSLSMQAGWLHLSNAQTGENNPGVDTLAIGLGLRFEF